MANLSAIWNGIANGASAVPQQLQDLAFQQSSRAQSLQAGDLANQTAALQLSQAQTAAKNEQDYQQMMATAGQSGVPPTQTAAAPSGAGSASPAGAPGSAADPGMTAPSGGLPATQNGLSGGQPLTPLQRSVMISESNGLASATSPKGAEGTMQTMPTTLTNPGFGVKPAQNNSPAEMQRVGADYLVAMQKRYGSDADALVAYNWGPANADKWIANGRNPGQLPPATKAYVSQTLGRVQQGQQQAQSQTQQNQPSPAEQVSARVTAGVDTPPPVYQQAIQAQDRQIKMLQGIYSQAMQSGKPAVAARVMQQISTLQGQQLELQKSGLAVQKEANDQTAKLAAGVKDQSSYNGLRAQIQSNPAMQQAVAGLGLTGDYNQDRNKLQTLADRSETLKDQQELKIKQGELQIKQQDEQRKQQASDAPKIAAAQAQQADTKRMEANTAAGLPSVPSISAAAPPGTTSAQLDAARKQVTAANAQYDKANAPAVEGARNVANLAAQAYVAVKNGTVKTGGVFNNAAEAVADRKGIGGGSYLLSAEQQEFNKLTANMVQQMQLLAGANGGARSASTAAMYNNYARAKPNIGLSPEANMAVAHGLYVGAQAQTQMNTFLEKYRTANPDATVQSGVAQWHRYERAAGPTMVFDPASRTMVPNTALLPTLEDGSPNPVYKNPDTFFQNGGHL